MGQNGFILSVSHTPPETLGKHRHLRDILKQIFVAGNRRSEVRWWDFVCVSARERNQFPSAHVSGTWALTFGLYATDRRAARWFALLAVGVSVACVYTRYHHAVDVLAALTVAIIAKMVGSALTRHLPSAA
jgi:membrane-associated phospholipid phosphatase